MTVVLHHSRARGTAKLVLLGVANHAGDGGAWPSVGTLATYANVSEREVQRALSKLIDAGELARHVQRGGTVDSHRHDFERPNRYEVLLSCPAWCDRTVQHRRRRDWTEAQVQLQLEGTPELVQLEDVASRAEQLAAGQDSTAPATRPRPAATLPPPRPAPPRRLPPGKPAPDGWRQGLRQQLLEGSTTTTEKGENG